MPRLLSLHNYYFRHAGSDTLFFQHNQLFRKNGWDTSVFSMQHPENESSEWSRYFIDEIDFSQSYSLSQKLIKACKVLYSVEARRKLAELLQSFSPNIAHIHCIYHHISPSVLPLLKRGGIPVALTAHDLKLMCPNYKMFNHNGICESCRDGNYLNVIRNRCVHGSLSASILVSLEASFHRWMKFYSKNVDCVIAPSQFYYRKLIEWGWNEANIVHIPNFINADEHVPKYEPGNYIVYFGRVSVEKGLATLIKAAIATNTQLCIIGTGSYLHALKNLSNGHESLIRFTGYKQGTELHTLVKNARAVVLPSEWYENAPMSILESYAMGKPVIGAQIGGIPELIKEGINGHLFEAGSVPDLIRVLEQLNNASKIALREMGQNARALVEQSYNEQSYYKEMSSLYSRLNNDMINTNKGY